MPQDAHPITRKDGASGPTDTSGGGDQGDARTLPQPLKITAGTLPKAYDGGDRRPYGSALYFLATPEAQSVVHRYAPTSSTTTTSAVRLRC